LSRFILLLGAHRSGTSLLNGCLNQLGYFNGDALIPANPGNPKGYFEDENVIGINDSILNAFDLRWDDPRPLPNNWHLSPKLLAHSQLLDTKTSQFSQASELTSIKDPRICRLLPFWEQAFSRQEIEVNYLVLCRKPEHAINSLILRDNTTFAQSALIWLRYNLELMVSLGESDYHVVFFDDFQSEPVSAIKSVPFISVEESHEALIRDFFDNKLIKANQIPQSFDKMLSKHALKLLDLCRETYTKMKHRDITWAKKTLDSLNLGYSFYHREINSTLDRQFMSPTSVENLKEQIEINTLKLQLEQIVSEIRTLKNKHKKDQ